MLDQIIESHVDRSDNLFQIEKDILETDKPNIWNIWKEGNMEKMLEVDFRKFVIAVMSAAPTGEKVEEITTFTFYSTVEQLSEQKRPKNQKNHG